MVLASQPVASLILFAALPVGESQYLIENGPLLHYLSAERDLVRRASEGSQSSGLLAMGGPAFDAGSSPTATDPASLALTLHAPRTYRGARSGCGDFQSLHFSPLPASADEVQEIAELWTRHLRSRKRSPGAASSGAADLVQLNGRAASEAAFKAEAPGKRGLHLATHAFFLGGHCASALEGARGIAAVVAGPMTPLPEITGDNPLLLSGLALAGANLRATAAADQEDGIVTAEEIAALDLSGVEWVVLSGCDTGAGEVRSGEGVLGLRRAFEVAGAGTLILSLRPVEDESAREWMRALYEARLQGGLGTAESVRAASLRMLHAQRARGESTHPLYWAGFVAAGDWR